MKPEKTKAAMRIQELHRSQTCCVGYAMCRAAHLIVFNYHGVSVAFNYHGVSVSRPRKQHFGGKLIQERKGGWFIEGKPLNLIFALGVFHAPVTFRLHLHASLHKAAGALPRQTGAFAKQRWMHGPGAWDIHQRFAVHQGASPNSEINSLIYKGKMRGEGRVV